MRRLETLIILLALGFYVWFLHRFGLGRVLSYVRLAGWGLALTIALEAIARLCNTIGWAVTVEDRPPSLRFQDLFLARIAGEAVDYTTPSAQLGGQFVMALMVRRKLSMERGFATVIVAALAELLGQIGFISAGLVFALDGAPALGRLFWPVVGGLALAVGLAAAFYFVQQKRPFYHLWRAAARFDMRGLRSAELADAAVAADDLLLDFYAHHRLRLLASWLCYVVAWGMGPVEIYILLMILHVPVSWHIAVLVEVLGQLLERATFMIPGKLVSQEGGKALILAMVGYPASVGFAVGLLRRLKEMAWVTFGLAALAAHRLLVERGDGALADRISAEHVLKIHTAQGERTL